MEHGHSDRNENNLIMLILLKYQKLRNQISAYSFRQTTDIPLDLQTFGPSDFWTESPGCQRKPRLPYLSTHCFFSFCQRMIPGFFKRNNFYKTEHTFYKINTSFFLINICFFNLIGDSRNF